MPEVISKRTARLLKDITGEAKLDQAVLTTLADALNHRLEGVEAGIMEMEGKYGTDFVSFKTSWEKGGIKAKHSYEVERDYWRWEELVTRKDWIMQALAWLE